jgi:hypothetical protein
MITEESFAVIEIFQTKFSFKLFQTDDYYQADDNEGDDTDDDISDAVELRFISFTGPKNRVTVVKKKRKVM